MVGAVSVDLRVNRISAISGHMHRLEGRRMRRGASGTPACACLPNDAYAQRWRLIRQTLIYLQPLCFTRGLLLRILLVCDPKYAGNDNERIESVQ